MKLLRLLVSEPLFQQPCRFYKRIKWRPQGKPEISRPRENQKPWTRRVLEEAVKPQYDVVELDMAQSCQRSAELKQRLDLATTVLPQDRALSNTIKMQIRNAKLLAVCQRLSVDERFFHLNRMEIQSEGLQTRVIRPSIGKLVVENSRLANLSPVFAGDLMIIWSDDASLASTLAKYLKKYHWIVPLAVYAENRLLTVKEFEWLVANRMNIAGQHAKTLNFLRSPTSMLLSRLSTPLLNLSSLLSVYLDELKKKEQ